MELYAGIDLHSNNSVVTVLDEADRTVYAKRLPNDLSMVIAALRSCEGTLRGVAVESTYNWYWLVDGLQDAGFTVHLVNTTAVKQYDGRWDKYHAKYFVVDDELAIALHRTM